MVNEQNPLSDYFRGASVYIKLPSCGFYSKKGTVEPTVSGEIEVFPMTTSDELLFKSPDALLNGESIAKVIQSCSPSVKNAYDLPMNDVEALLLAIRQSTYGDQIDYSSSCPECKTIKEFGLSISWVLSDMQTLEPDKSVKLDNGLMIKVRPYSYKSSVKAALLAYNEGQFLNMLLEEDISDEEKALKATESYKKAINLTIELLANSILSVHKDGKLITDNPEFIKEWIEKASSKDSKKIEKVIKEMNETGVKKEVIVDCDKCNHEWTTKVIFDPSSFFVQSS